MTPGSSSARFLGHPGSATRGFNLVEVMVVLVVIAVGMLGIAKLQALTISSTGVASLRSMAALQASSLAATMHADRDYWSGTPVPFTVSKGNITDATGKMTAAVNCTSTGTLPCTNVQIAAFDVQTWVNNLNTVLPNLQASVSCPAAAIPLTCVIQISWTENAVAVNTNEAAATASNIASGNVAAIQIPTYTLYVEP
jgi:type IV pilus assembly protein PilV